MFQVSNLIGIKMLKDILFEKVSSYDEYIQFVNRNSTLLNQYRSLQQELTNVHKSEFHIKGFCKNCNKEKKLLVDYKYGSTVENEKLINWRERLVCSCKLNNRLRATVHFLQEHSKLFDEGSWSYISEQTTPLYKLLLDKKINVVGSEYLEDKLPYGCINARGLRNETATALTFHNESFDISLSFDVLEHVPDYQLALMEVYRILKPCGSFIFTAPFNVNSQTNIVRAKIAVDGEIEHLLPPEYHGDPISEDGVLCFYHFAWEIVEQLRDVGFNDAAAYFYASERFGYLGGPAMIFKATKS